MKRGKGDGVRYIRITETVFESVAFRTLPGSAAKLWLDLRAQFYGSNNGQLMLTPKVVERRGWNSPVKLIRARDILLERGLIKYVRKCSPNQFHRASLFAFTDLEIQRSDANSIPGSQPTHDYVLWTPPAVTAKCVLPKRKSSMYRNGSDTASETVGRRAVNGAKRLPKR